jgi:hypothetical protein
MRGTFSGPAASIATKKSITSGVKAVMTLTLASRGQLWKWGLIAILSVLAIVAFLSLQNRASHDSSSQYWRGIVSERTAGLAAVYSETLPAAMMATTESQASEQGSSPGPMIIRTVSLRLTSKQLNDMRSRIDATIRRFQGYIDTLTIRSDVGLRHSISATLRIPANQLESALAELKMLGSLIEESEISQDTTAGYTDLVARLSNARRTEQRLLGLLSDRSGKLGEIIQVEKEIGEVRERIERMEGQQRRIENQVRFASVKLELTEEGEAQFAGVGARTQAAFTDGYRTAIANTIGLTLAALRYGPTVAVYFLLLLPLVIVVWRRLRLIRRIA